MSPKISKKQKDQEIQLLKNVMIEVLRDDQETTFENCKPLYDKWANKEGLPHLTFSKYSKYFDLVASTAGLY